MDNFDQIKKVVLLVIAVSFCWTASFVFGKVSQKPIELVSGDFQKLVAKKDLIKQGDPQAVKFFESVKDRADRVLDLDALSVTQKKTTPPSGDKRDYYTLAPYWWPDPKKADGLPYIRRDGRVNPTTRGEHVDYDRKDAFFHRVSTLSSAAFYSDEPQYAHKAVELLDTWFVNPKTRMNPHLEFAQGIPGRNTGRGIGIIEWCGIDRVLNSIVLLRAIDAFDEPSYQTIVIWVKDYLNWLQTSRMGRDESVHENNHGTWYDVQVVSLLLFLDRKAEAREILEAVKTKRIATQIEPDGRQPFELARTKSYSYSRMNLSAFRRLVKLGNKVGVDLWNYETPDGRSIRKAADFMAAYGRGKKKWPYPQL